MSRNLLNFVIYFLVIYSFSSVLGLSSSFKSFVAVLHSDRTQSPTPFAFFLPHLSPTSSSTAILSLLPYNFPHFLPLLNTVKNALQLNRTLPSHLTNELSSYFRSLPLYCQPSVQIIFQQYAIHQLASTILVPNKYFARKLQKIKDKAEKELIVLENSFRYLICA